MVKFKVEIDEMYPVGSIYLSVNNTNPKTLFGGKWTQIEDKFLLACSKADGEGVPLYPNGSTGGSATVSLTEYEMPRHTHIQNSHNHAMPYNWSDGSGSSSGYTYTQNRHTTTINTQYKTATNKYTGGNSDVGENESNGIGHENMPPYLAVYVWVRTE